MRREQRGEKLPASAYQTQAQIDAMAMHQVAKRREAAEHAAAIAARSAELEQSIERDQLKAAAALQEHPIFKLFARGEAAVRGAVEKHFPALHKRMPSGGVSSLLPKDSPEKQAQAEVAAADAAPAEAKPAAAPSTSADTAAIKASIQASAEVLAALAPAPTPSEPAPAPVPAAPAPIATPTTPAPAAASSGNSPKQQPGGRPLTPAQQRSREFNRELHRQQDAASGRP